MQATKSIVGPERGATPRRRAVFGWSVLVCTGLVLVIAGELSFGPPLPARYLGDRVGDWWQPLLGIGEILGPGLAVAVLLVIVNPLRHAAGTFGCVAAAALATTTSAALLLGMPEMPRAWLAAVVGGSGLLAPLLRERGTGSLLLLALPIAAGAVVARRTAQSDGRAAQQLAALRSAALEQRREPVCIAVPEALGRSFRTALAKSLRAPYAEPGVDVVVLPAGTEEIGLLQTAGYPLLALADGAITATPGAEVETPPLSGAAARLLEGRGPIVVVEPPIGRWRLRVVTPTGVVGREVEDPAHGIGLADDSLRAYLEAVEDLPAGFAILVRVEGPSLPSGSPWVVLRT